MSFDEEYLDEQEYFEGFNKYHEEQEMKEQLRIEIIKWLGSRYTVTPYMAKPSDKDIDQNKVEELVETLDGLLNPGTEMAVNVKIKVNGRDIELPKGKITYDDIVKWAGGRPGVLYSITFSKAFDNHKHEGTIVPGEELLISDGTRISCYHTGAA
jgi:hypothetical protein